MCRRGSSLIRHALGACVVAVVLVGALDGNRSGCVPLALQNVSPEGLRASYATLTSS